MTGKTLRSSLTVANSAAAQLNMDRRAVAIRIAQPSTPPSSQATPYMAGNSFAEVVATAKSSRKPRGKRAKPRPDGA